MIRAFVLTGLLVIIFYCAAAGAGAGSSAAASPANVMHRSVHVHRQFIPGTLAVVHVPTRNLAVSTQVAAG
jgi:hypothetical protein